jgi:hypothetical protein
MPLLLDCSGVGLNVLVLGSALSLPAQPAKPAQSYRNRYQYLADISHLDAPLLRNASMHYSVGN